MPHLSTSAPTEAVRPRHRRLRRVQESVLAATFLAMAAYEAAEVWFLESPRRSPVGLEILVHGLQVAVILAATWVVLRALRTREKHEDALARMVEKVAFAHESERQRISFDLHDGVSSLVVGARMHLETARDLRNEEPARSDAELAKGLARLDEAIVETRRILRALRPSAVDTDGLAVAVRRSLDDAAQSAGWTVRFDHDLGDASLPSAVETAAFRIVQEALTNASRHADSRAVEVRLHRDGGSLALEVRDHGAGFTDDGAPSQGLGLASMRERASLLGGRCSIETTRGAGTVVRATLPLQPSLEP